MAEFGLVVRRDDVLEMARRTVDRLNESLAPEALVGIAQACVKAGRKDLAQAFFVLC